MKALRLQPKANSKALRPGKDRFRILAFALMLGTLTVACGLGPAAANPPASQAASSSGNSSTVGPDQGNSSTQVPLPGTEEFGLTNEGLVTSIEAVESLIAECMREAGFDYIAVDYGTVRRGMVADKSLPGLSEREYIVQYGFGISTLYTGLPPQQADEYTPAKIGLGEQNVRIYNALSPADKTAYNHTLFGDHPEATFAVSIEMEDFSRTGGCTRKAIEQVFSPEQLSATYYNPKDGMINQDPRMVAALGMFSDCMREAGFEYSHPDDLEPAIRKRLEAITGGLPVEGLSADALAALQELQAEERASALVAFDCTVKYFEPVEEQIEREMYSSPVQ